MKTDRRFPRPTNDLKLQSHNSPRTSHLPHTSPQMRIGKILIYGNCDQTNYSFTRLKRGSITRCMPSFLKSGRTQKASAGFDGTGKPLNIHSVMDLRQYMRSWLFKNVKKKKQQQQKRFSTHRIFLSALLLKWFISRSRNWIFYETNFTLPKVTHA